MLYSCLGLGMPLKIQVFNLLFEKHPFKLADYLEKAYDLKKNNTGPVHCICTGFPYIFVFLS